MRLMNLVLMSLMMLVGAASAWTPDYPQPKFPKSQWWDDAWWDKAELPVPQNHKIRIEESSFTRGENEFPVLILRPDDDKQYPAVLFIHGRRGLDDLVQRHARRVAARGFVVLAPDLYAGRFIEKLPIEHDYELEADVSAALTMLMQRKDLSGNKACLYSHTRGGYYTLKAAVKYKRQDDAVACYVSYYPHWQDPNLPEPMQVYRYAPEADKLKVPTLIFIGDKEQYQRRRAIETAVRSMQELKRDVQLVVYPGVGRGFDFRPPNVRTFADDLAAKDASARSARFMRKHLK